MTQKFSAKFSTPDQLRIYAIGDIHGYAQALDRMHEAITNDLIANEPSAGVHIVYIGDYIDRGPDSKGVIERLIERKTRGDGVPKTFLAGNHEKVMLDFLLYNDGQPADDSWLRWGGMQALQSYGVYTDKDLLTPAEIEALPALLRESVPPAHMDFLQSLELSLTLGDYMFVHAGVDPRKSEHEQSVRDLTTMREPFLSWQTCWSKCVVHGHSITPDHEPEVLGHRIGIDTGLYEGGPLTCVVLEGVDVRFLYVR